jgi:signal transduction histidine kinase
MDSGTNMLRHRISNQPVSVETKRSGREAIHDIRNLFGVVASASHMLEEDGPTPARKAMLLSAIEDAATRGARLTTDLLGRAADEPKCAALDLNEELRALEGLLRALAGCRAEIHLDLSDLALPVKINPTGFEATMLELVTNACAAFDSPGNISIRTRRAGKRAWICIADDAAGMNPATLRNALSGTINQSAGGNGLNRVRRFVGESHGRLHIRSHEGRGTVAVISFPLVLGLTTSKS